MRLLTLSILLSMIGCYHVAAQSADSETISGATVNKFETEALEGDGLAAFKLSNFASYGVASKHNKDAALYWATISAEDGLPAGSYQLGMILYNDDSDPSNIVRAEFWLKRAKAQGITLADVGLCLIEKKKNPTLPECKLPSSTIQVKPIHDR